MSSGGSQVTTTEPWKGVQPYLKASYGKAQEVYENTTPQWYTGQTQASFSPDQLAAHEGVRDWSLKGAPNVMNAALGAYKRGTSADMLDVANNPYVQGMAQRAAEDAYAPLVGQLAGIRGGAVQSGGYGGSRQGIAEGTAIGAAADSATRAAADIYGQAYGQGLGHQATMFGGTSDLLSAGMRPYTALAAVGEEQQRREQALIEDAKARYDFEQNLPYSKLDAFTNTLSGTSGLLGGSGVKTAPGVGPLGMLAQGASVYKTLSGMPF